MELVDIHLEKMMNDETSGGNCFLNPGVIKAQSQIDLVDGLVLIDPDFIPRLDVNALVGVKEKDYPSFVKAEISNLPEWASLFPVAFVAVGNKRAQLTVTHKKFDVTVHFTFEPGTLVAFTSDTQNNWTID